MNKTKTHYRKMYNPNYLGAYSLEPGQDMILTIKQIKVEQITNCDGRKEDAPVMRFEERGIKPMILNSTNSKTIKKIYKTPYLEDWVGKKIQIYAANIKAFGEEMEALRIREYKPKEPKMMDVKLDCEECKGKIVAFNNLTAEKVATHTKKTYGKFLCIECATKMKEEGEDNNVN